MKYADAIAYVFAAIMLLAAIALVDWTFLRRPSFHEFAPEFHSRDSCWRVSRSHPEPECEE